MGSLLITAKVLELQCVLIVDKTSFSQSVFAIKQKEKKDALSFNE